MWFRSTMATLGDKVAPCNFESHQLYFRSVKCIHGSFSVFPIPVFVSVCLSLCLGLSLSLCPLCLCQCVSLIIRLPHVKSPGTRQTWIFILLIHLRVCDLNLSPNVSFPIIKMEIVTLTLLSCHEDKMKQRVYSRQFSCWLLTSAQ